MGARFNLVIIITVTFSVMLSSQEKPKANDLFCWFPDGKYSKFRHEDCESMKTAKSYETFSKFVEPEASMRGIGRRLPVALEAGICSWTTARLEEIKITKYKGTKEPSSPADRGTTFFTGAGGYNYILHGVGKLLIVCRFTDDLETLIKQVLKKGEVEKTGESLDGRDVYFYSQKHYDGDSKSYYAYVTWDGELLVAPSMEHLSSMVATGRGLELGIIDNPDYQEFFKLVPSLGPTWSFNALHPFLQALLERLEEEKADQYDIDRHLRMMDNVQKFSVRTTFLGDSIVYLGIDAYIDEEKAKEIQEIYASHQYASQFPKESTRIFQLIGEYTCEDNLLYCRHEYTPELLEALEKEHEEKLSEMEKELAKLEESDGDAKRIEYLKSKIRFYKDDLQDK